MPKYSRPFHVPPATVRAIRCAQGLTQQQFGDRMAVTRRTVIRWERDGAVFDRLEYLMIRNAKLRRLERMTPAGLSLEEQAELGL